MAYFHHNDKDVAQKLKRAETEELIEYCKEQGYSAEQTEQFVKNSLASIYPED